jgi:hypothetical protein
MLGRSCQLPLSSRCSSTAGQQGRSMLALARCMSVATILVSSHSSFILCTIYIITEPIQPITFVLILVTWAARLCSLGTCFWPLATARTYQRLALRLGPSLCGDSPRRLLFGAFLALACALRDVLGSRAARSSHCVPLCVVIVYAFGLLFGALA